MGKRRFLVSVIGGHKCGPDEEKMAEDIGRVIAEEGAVLVSGGLGGIMEAATRGAKRSGGLTVGIIPGDDKDAANGYVDIVIATGIGYSRNTIVASGTDIVVALPGEYGTLSEIGFALASKKKVYSFGSWDIPDVIKLDSTEDLRSILKDSMMEG